MPVTLATGSVPAGTSLTGLRPGVARGFHPVAVRDDRRFGVAFFVGALRATFLAAVVAVALAAGLRTGAFLAGVVAAGALAKSRLTRTLTEPHSETVLVPPQVAAPQREPR